MSVGLGTLYRPNPPARQALKDSGVPERLTILRGIPHGFRIAGRNLGAEVRSFLDGVWGGSTS